MSPLDRLRWAIAPDQRRSLSLMLGGIAVFTVLGGLATLFEVPRVVAGFMGLVMLAAWFVGACGMVGYFRWFFRSEVDEQLRR
jgi:uncharacterized membrane-anchored protein